MIMKDGNEHIPATRIVHGCNPPNGLNLILPVMRFLMGKNLRSRFFLHSGQIDHHLDLHGIPKEILPACILPEDAKLRPRLGLRSKLFGNNDKDRPSAASA
eukprot:CAMPEP_0118673338 /NCGR_PEP_ID=MMETSP0800-20121206/262_1 /TAXON_ID=210618 ORGANISM="Striatella unipunctata, Strain CCMP2910" /NCGR_SAMPLE_ID=MMETSP0800 /ASSEMBLY_ACC=CAM_ASM_000638 /LENGTH=100 /DNA_ID=CAMNT_0006568381 /DNA_START=394 /DNA_END=696 /DNA_ORIENTATION=-